MQKLSFLYLAQCSLFDTNSRRLINVAFFVSFRATKNYKVSTAVKTCFQLPNWHDGIFFLLQSIRASIFYGLELVLTFSFKVRNRFRIRINNVMSVGNNRGGHLGTPNSSFRWLHFCSWMSYSFIYRSMSPPVPLKKDARATPGKLPRDGHRGSVYITVCIKACKS